MTRTPNFSPVSRVTLTRKNHLFNPDADPEVFQGEDAWGQTLAWLRVQSLAWPYSDEGSAGHDLTVEFADGKSWTGHLNVARSDSSEEVT